MESIANLMHALSSPDAYNFAWRNGELCIEPIAASGMPAAGVLVHGSQIDRQSISASSRAQD